MCVYLLARLLYGRGLALATLALLVIGPPVALFLQVFTNGGYADTLFFGALLLLLATLLARPETARSRSGAGACSPMAPGDSRRDSASGATC